MPLRSAPLRVFWLHDLILLDRPGDFRVGKRLLLRVPFNLSIRGSDAFVTPSAATAARLRVHHPRLAAPVVVQPYALAPNLFESESAPIEALAGRPFAVVVGDLSPRKNLRHVVELWPDVQRRVPDAALAVVGPVGWGHDEGAAALDSLCQRGHAVRLVQLPDAQLRWAYENAACALCPSVLEGFGLPAAEAAAFGTPLITSEDPALNEARNRHGQMVEIADRQGWINAIVARFEEPQLRTSNPMRMPGVTWDQVADTFVNVVRGR